MILKTTHYPKEVTGSILINGNYGRGESSRSAWLPYAQSLEQAGLGTATITKGKFGLEQKVSLTDKGKQLAREPYKPSMRGIKVLTYSGHFGEITGITFSNSEHTRATVEYTESYEPTPFTSLKVPEVSFRGKKMPPTVNRKAFFQMYDDGWRIVQSGGVSLKERGTIIKDTLPKSDKVLQWAPKQGVRTRENQNER
ncbi:MAG: hypothetical protein WCH04_05695 [Gammaproteobacteria bacterium]